MANQARFMFRGFLYPPRIYQGNWYNEYMIDNVSDNDDADDSNVQPYQFDHVAMVTPDIARTVAWYVENIPGARVLFQDNSWAFVEANGTKLAFVVRDQHPGHLAWRVSPAELERLATERGKEIKPHRDGTRSFYLDGPNEQAVEIISYEGSRWEKEMPG